jgi:hypothetical protein
MRPSGFGRHEIVRASWWRAVPVSCRFTCWFVAGGSRRGTRYVMPVISVIVECIGGPTLSLKPHVDLQATFSADDSLVALLGGACARDPPIHIHALNYDIFRKRQRLLVWCARLRMRCCCLCLCVSATKLGANVMTDRPTGAPLFVVAAQFKSTSNTSVLFLFFS